MYNGNVYHFVNYSEREQYRTAAPNEAATLKHAGKVEIRPTQTNIFDIHTTDTDLYTTQKSLQTTDTSIIIDTPTQTSNDTEKDNNISKKTKAYHLKSYSIS